MIVSIDPGQTKCACAFFEKGRLVSLDWQAPASEGSSGKPLARVSVVVVEKPNINENTPNWKNMLDCAWSGGLVAGSYGAPVVAFEPNAWKGGVKKPIHHKRIMRVLAADEVSLLPVNVAAVIAAACKAYASTGKVTKYSHEWHNLLDAIAIGLFYLGRTGRGGSVKR